MHTIQRFNFKSFSNRNLCSQLTRTGAGAARRCCVCIGVDFFNGFFGATLAIFDFEQYSTKLSSGKLLLSVVHFVTVKSTCTF